MTAADSTGRSGTVRNGLVALVVVVIALAIVYLVWTWPSSPDSVTLDDAVGQAVSPEEASPGNGSAIGADATTASGDDGSTDSSEGVQQSGNGSASVADPADETGGPDGLNEVEGTWTVDPTIGGFNFDDSTGSFVGFRVVEDVSGVGEVTAVGRTPAVSGSVEIVGDQVTAVKIEADMTALVSDDNRRAEAARKAVGVDEHRTASFTLTEPIRLAEPEGPMKNYSGQAVGELTINGVANPAVIDIEASEEDGILVVVGLSEVIFADYDVIPPSSRLVTVASEGEIEIQLFLTKSGAVS